MGDIHQPIDPSKLPAVVEVKPDQMKIAKVTRFYFNLNRSLDHFWKLTDQSRITPLKQAMWANNGMQLGVIHERDLPKLISAMPTTLGSYQSLLTALDVPTSIRTSPRITSPITVDLTIPSLAVHETRIKNGKLQLLAKLIHNKNNTVTIALTPHHQQPRTLLEKQIATVRAKKKELPSPLENELHGKKYNQLSINLDLANNEYLAIGMYWPWAEQIQKARENAARLAKQRKQALAKKLQQQQTRSTATSNANHPATTLQPQIDPNKIELGPVDDPQDVPHDIVPPALPAHAGRTLFAGEYAQIPIQTILIISLDDNQPPTLDNSSP